MHLPSFILFIILFAHSARCDDQEDDDPVLSYLNVHPDSVEKHDLAHIRVVRSDNSTHVRFRAFGNDNNIWLHPADSRLFTDETSVFEGRYENGQIVHYRITDILKKVGKIFENGNHLASIVIGTDPDAPTVNGHMVMRGKSLMIRSLPTHVVKQYLRKRRSIESLDEIDPNASYHVAIHLKESSEQESQPQKVSHPMLKRFAPQMPAANYYRPSYHDTTSDALYPEILQYIDATHNGDWDTSTKFLSFLEYWMAFWNGVDLIYRNIDVPRIRLNIAAVVLNTAPEATPYFYKNTRNGVIDPDKALEDSGLFFFDYPTFHGVPYDIVVSMTKMPLGSWNGKSHTVGISYFGACYRGLVGPSYAEAKNMTKGTALVHDNGAFFGISVAAHELVHVMHVDHDTSDEDPACEPAKGFLMASHITPAGNSHSLSICSLRAIGKAKDAGKLDCLMNKPRTSGKRLPTLMPGKIASLDEQCRALSDEFKTFGKPCIPRDRDYNVCAQIWCETQGGRFCSSTSSAAADGTPCPGVNATSDSKSFCLQNVCTTI